MAREKTNRTAVWVFSGFGAAAVLALILWAVGILKTPTKDTPTPGSEKPLGGSASEVLYGK
jgi:ABC-type transporter Mla subunit MlaD